MAKKTKNNADMKAENIAANNTPVTQDPAPAPVPDAIDEAKQDMVEIIKAPASIEELWERIETRFQALESKLAIKVKEGTGRGPLSTRAMTVDDAIKIMTGDLKGASIKSAAQTLGLSYGQVYSARNGYTFKEQYAAMMAAKPKTTETKK